MTLSPLLLRVARTLAQWYGDGAGAADERLTPRDLAAAHAVIEVLRYGSSADAAPQATQMLERIARAICIADGCDPDAKGYGVGITMPRGEPYPLWQARLKQARAVLEAMREPTAEMENAGIAAEFENIDDYRPTRVWRAMIAAALGETPGP